MSEVKVTLKDGSVKEFAAGTSYLEIAKSLNQKLGKQALLAVVDGVNKDLSDTIEKDAAVEFVTPDTKEGLHAIRHTASHVMAQAIQHLFPGVKFAIGPAIDTGFYYDIDSEHVFTPEDLTAIEKEMAKIVKQNLPLVRSEVPRKDALTRFAAENEIYKVELINDLPEDAVISLYTQGDFTDLCAGPHCPSTGRVKAFKLMSLAGAYWRGNEKNKMLQRIYGTAFPSKEELDEYLHMLGSRLPLLPSKRHAYPQRHSGILASGTSQIPLRTGYDPHDHEPGSVDPFRPLGSLPGKYVFHQDRRHGLRHQTHELPRRHDGL